LFVILPVNVARIFKSASPTDAFKMLPPAPYATATLPDFMPAINKGVLRRKTSVVSKPYFWKYPASRAIQSGAMRGLIVE
jgi:hypothetical protein